MWSPERTMGRRSENDWPGRRATRRSASSAGVCRSVSRADEVAAELVIPRGARGRPDDRRGSTRRSSRRRVARTAAVGAGRDLRRRRQSPPSLDPRARARAPRLGGSLVCGRVCAMLAAPPGGSIVASRSGWSRIVLRDAGYDVMRSVRRARGGARCDRRHHRPDIVCLDATMPGSTSQLLITMDRYSARGRGDVGSAVTGSPRGCGTARRRGLASPSPTPSMPSTHWCRALA